MKYEPMLAETGNINDLSNTSYIFEPKLDGTRCVLVKHGRQIYMFNRLGNDISYLYPQIKMNFEKYKEDFILDGEIVCYNENGIPNYKLLMKRELITSKQLIDLRDNAIPATYVAFDILELNNNELMTQPLEERKKQLKQLIKENKNVERILFTEDGNQLWELIRKNKMEGVMAKKKESYYVPAERSRDWLKLKNNKSVDAVITGYIEDKNNSKTFSALNLGVYKNGKLTHIGKVENGWDEEAAKFIMNRINPLILKKQGKNVELKPEMVCEVDYLEVTKEKELRATIFKRLRAKPADKCTWKQLVI